MWDIIFKMVYFLTILFYEKNLFNGKFIWWLFYTFFKSISYYLLTATTLMMSYGWYKIYLKAKYSEEI